MNPYKLYKTEEPPLNTASAYLGRELQQVPRRSSCTFPDIMLSETRPSLRGQP